MNGTSISPAKAEVMFCPEDIFECLKNYFSLVSELDNVPQPQSQVRTFSTRTIGTVTITNNIDSKQLLIVRNGEELFSARNNNNDWTVDKFALKQHEIFIINHLPNDREQLFAEFYGRKLTEKLKTLFQEKNYPIGLHISLHDAQDPYSFCISPDSEREKIVFLGFNLKQNNVFKSYFYSDRSIFIATNNLPLKHINQLGSHR